MSKILFSIVLVCITNAAICQTQEATLEQLTSWMCGSFDSEAQAKRDTSYLNVSLKMTQIWKRQDNATWIYVEQALTSTPKKPYRQRIYKVEGLGGNRFISTVYSLPTPDAYVGGADQPKLLKNLTPEMLTHLEGCEISLVYDVKNSKFIGSTANLCHNNWNGAYVASSEVEISATELMSWDRGWDSDGKQVWGATKGGYIFIKSPR